MNFNNKLTMYISKVLYYQYMNLFFACFSNVFLIFNYWSFGIGIYVLRLPILVQVSKKIFGIINKLGVQTGIEGWEKLKN